MCRYTTLCNIKVTVLNISDMWWDFKLLNHNTLNCYSLKHCNKSVIARDMASGRQTDRQTDRQTETVLAAKIYNATLIFTLQMITNWQAKAF